MTFRTLLQAMVDQFVALGDAPLAMLIAILAVALIVWRLMKWRYDAVIARLRKSNDRKESMILLLKGGGPTLAPEQPRAPADDAQAAEDVRNRQKALRRIVNAIDAAHLATQSGDPRETDNAMSAMGLALLTARNVFDLPTPAPTGSTAADLDAGRRFLELVRPALFLGQDDQARRSAAAMLRRAAAA